jgi:S1-C subfamily serine protease
MGLRSGVLVAGVQAGGPADRAGLRQGDVIVSAAGRGVQGPSQLVNVVEAASVGQPLPLTVNRNGSVVEISVLPGEMVPTRSR